MPVAILAPVPAELIQSAIGVCADHGRVAFGTNAFDVFSKVEEDYGVALPVLIYPTVHYGDPDKVSRPGYACFHARFLRLKQADRNGKHPDGSLRPSDVDRSRVRYTVAVFLGGNGP